MEKSYSSCETFSDAAIMRAKQEAALAKKNETTGEQ